MRSEKEVLKQLLDFAGENDMVRAVILNGSRINVNAPKDIFQDYDVVFAVTNPKYFLENQEWIKKFGQLVVMQQNDCCEDGAEWYIFLMLFEDGIRIDLSFHPIGRMDIQLRDSLKLVLMDKDGLFQELGPPSEASYLIEKPTQSEFDKTVNEIWWCSPNVAKGIWRDELTYAKYMLDIVVSPCVIRMLAWHVSMNNDWQVNVGKAGKWLKRYLPEDLWKSLEKTYAGTEYADIWDSLFEIGSLTRRIGVELADNLGYKYPMEDDIRVTEYLSKVRLFPKDADTFL